MDFLELIKLYLILSIALTVLLSVYTYTLRRTALTRTFSVFLGLITIYAFGYLMEVNSKTMEEMLFWNQIQYLTIPFFPAIWLNFSLQFADSRFLENRKLMYGAFVLPFMTFVIRSTNNMHHLYYSQVALVHNGYFSLLALEKGPWYFIHMAYTAICIVIASYYLISKGYKLARNWRNKIPLIMVSLIPYFGYLLNAFNVGNLYIDYSALTIPFINFLLLFILFKQDILGLMFLAREKLFESSSEGIIILDANLDVVDINLAALHLLERRKNDVCGKKVNIVFSKYPQVISAIETKTPIELKIHSNHKINHYYVNISQLQRRKEKAAGWIINLTDITIIMQSKEILQKSEKKYRTISSMLRLMCDNVPDMIWAKDLEKNYIFANKALCNDLLNAVDTDEPIGKTDTFFAERERKAHPDRPEWHTFGKTCWETDEMTIETGCAQRFDTCGNIMGNLVVLDVHKAPLFNDLGEMIGVVGSARDVTEQRKKQDIVEYLSFHDQLTGLYNRRFYEEELQRLDVERNLPISLVMGDINGLKLANDAFGHVNGDRLLIKTSEIIKRQCREDDIIARVGGDEFIILLPKTDLFQAEKLAKRIMTAVSNEKIDSLDMSVSLGWAVKTHCGETMEEVYKAAEDCMYQRKLCDSPSMRGNTIKTIIRTMYEKLPGEKEHSDRVSDICQKIGCELGLSLDEIAEVKTAGMLHDIGKIALNEAILQKPDALSEAEYSEVKRHCETGYRILSSVNEMARLADYTLFHHENWDGSGYPKGIKGKQIPLQSRIIRIADAYDAMVSDRAYRGALSHTEAVNEIVKYAGNLFDPTIAAVFIEKVLEADVRTYRIADRN